MRYARILTRAIAAAGLLWSSASNAADQIFRNEEYAYQIAVPAGHHVCPTNSGGHVHGFMYNIDPKPDCDPEPYPGARVPSSIHIWPDYNATFDTSVYPTWKGCKVSPLGPMLRRAFANKVRSWGTCLSQKRDVVELHLLVLAGSERSLGEDAGKPCMSYDMFLKTYRNRLNRDLVEFRKFLRKVKIHPGDCPG